MEFEELSDENSRRIKTVTEKKTVTVITKTKRSPVTEEQTTPKSQFCATQPATSISDVRRASETTLTTPRSSSYDRAINRSVAKDRNAEWKKASSFESQTLPSSIHPAFSSSCDTVNRQTTPTSLSSSANASQKLSGTGSQWPVKPCVRPAPYISATTAPTGGSQTSHSKQHSNDTQASSWGYYSSNIYESTPIAKAKVPERNTTKTPIKVEHEAAYASNSAAAIPIPVTHIPAAKPATLIGTGKYIPARDIKTNYSVKQEKCLPVDWSQQQYRKPQHVPSTNNQQPASVLKSPIDEKAKVLISTVTQAAAAKKSEQLRSPTSRMKANSTEGETLFAPKISLQHFNLVYTPIFLKDIVHRIAAGYT